MSAPDRPAPDRPAPDQPAPDRPAPDRPAPDRPAPDRPAPDRPALDRAAPDRAVPPPAGDAALPPISARPFDREAFWTVAVGLPALVSVLRLWAEAGDLETTLLLVANVGPVNLLASLVVTATWLVSAALVAVFTVGAVTRRGRRTGTATLTWGSLFAQLSWAAPRWLRIMAFALAALTWQLLYLPLLLLAACAAFGLHPTRPRRTGWLLAAAAYLAVFGPVAVSATIQGYAVPALLVLAPPVLVALGATRPIPAGLARPFSSVAQVTALALVVLAAAPVFTAPVLPRGVVTVTGEGDEPPQPVRGHVVEVNDTTTAVLRSSGGVEFIPNRRVGDRVLCPDEGRAARYRLFVFGLHIEDSVLSGAGRLRRPSPVLDPRCRPTVPERPMGVPFTEPTSSASTD
ncbi:hypothetical protein [Micromonospora endolithica]|uniref:hypothetical protein n=1 Tax=Micromonospora endolithica TaxID=230091 RepID=UPI0011ABEA6C|nr:hypothetical protein [Micromonospora endolithica]TWJ23968.1 hypothetical protein JD76_04114 [Micromonospora endolithica]